MKLPISFVAAAALTILPAIGAEPTAPVPVPPAQPAAPTQPPAAEAPKADAGKVEPAKDGETKATAPKDSKAPEAPAKQ